MVPNSAVAATPHVVIIGGGITGLAAALALEGAATPVSYTLLERDTQLGGKIRTEQVGDFLIEGGPDSFVGQKPQGIALAEALGLSDQLCSTRPARRSTMVLIKGQPQPLPDGMLLVVPTRLLPFAASPLFSPLGKLRMALDLLIPARRSPADESLADFIRRRLGREALDRLAEPLMAGIHSSDPERQSLLATFPRFQALEAQHGSLIRGMLAQRRKAQPAPATATPGTRFQAAPFVTLQAGIGTLVAALAARLHGDIRLGVQAAAIVPGAGQPYSVVLADGERIPADAVIVATPAYTAAQLVTALEPALAAGLRAIRYVSTATITLAYRQTDIGRPLAGYGLVIPRGEGRQINALTLSSRKFAGRAPDDCLLIRAFVGGARTPAALQLDDQALLALVQHELRDLMQISAQPLVSRIYRWFDGNPQYDVGHLERVGQLEARCPPGLLLAGSAYRGVGIPDCIGQGQRAAAQVLECLARGVHT